MHKYFYACETVYSVLSRISFPMELKRITFYVASVYCSALLLSFNMYQT